MRKLHFFLSLALALGCAPMALAGGGDKWEKTIQGFEKRDAASPPAEGGIVFIGSSSIRMWNTGKDFPELGIVNRGFGGSITSDINHFAHRILLPYKPRLVVIYVGDNDIAFGKDPEMVFSDTKTLFSMIHDSLPRTKIIYLSIKPSLTRWNLMEKMRKTNALIREHASKQGHIQYIDLDAPMLDETGKPQEDLFLADGLHLNAKGYALWNKIVGPYLTVED